VAGAAGRYGSDLAEAPGFAERPRLTEALVGAGRRLTGPGHAPAVTLGAAAEVPGGHRAVVEGGIGALFNGA